MRLGGCGQVGGGGLVGWAVVWVWGGGGGGVVVSFDPFVFAACSENSSSRRFASVLTIYCEIHHSERVSYFAYFRQPEGRHS